MAITDLLNSVKGIISLISNCGVVGFLGDVAANTLGELFGDATEKGLGFVVHKFEQSNNFKNILKYLETQASSEEQIDKLNKLFEDMQAENKQVFKRRLSEDTKKAISRKDTSCVKKIFNDCIDEINTSGVIEDKLCKEFISFNNADKDTRKLVVDCLWAVKEEFISKKLKGKDSGYLASYLADYINTKFDNLTGLIEVNQAMMEQLLLQGGSGDFSIEEIKRAPDDGVRWLHRTCPNCGYSRERLIFDKRKNVVCSACGESYSAKADKDSTFEFEVVEQKLDEINSGVQEVGGKVDDSDFDTFKMLVIQNRKDIITLKAFLTQLEKDLKDKNSNTVLINKKIKYLEAKISEYSQSDKKTEENKEKLQKEKPGELSDKKSGAFNIVNDIDNDITSLEIKSANEWYKKIETWITEKVGIQSIIVDSKDLEFIQNLYAKLNDIGDKISEVRKQMNRAKGKQVKELQNKLDGYVDELSLLYKELKWNVQKPCEFFFEYRIIPSPENSGKLGDKEYPEPKLFVECDNRGEYKLFAIIPEWSCGTENFKEQQLSDTDTNWENEWKRQAQKYVESKTFNVAQVQFNPGGHIGKNVNFANVFEENNKLFVGRVEVMNYMEYWQAERRFDIMGSFNPKFNLNGYGKIRLLHKAENNDEVKYIDYFFFTNFTFRKRVVYQISLKNEKSVESPSNDGEEEKKQKPHAENTEIRINLLSSETDKKPEVILNHRERGKDLGQFELSGKEISFKYNGKADINGFYLTFKDKSDEKYLLLEQMASNHKCKVSGDSRRNKATAEELVCPFCHRQIKWNDYNGNDRYKSGGVSCQGSYLKVNGSYASIKTADKAVEGCLYCDKDLNKSKSGFAKTRAGDSEYCRILPQDFLGADSFRLAVIGETRSGKSFMLTRMFPFEQKREYVAIDQSPLNLYFRNGGIFGERLQNVEVQNENDFVLSKNKTWRAEVHKDFVWNARTGHCPDATKKTAEQNEYDILERNPIVLSFEKKASLFKKTRKNYVFVYDMPGESFSPNNETSQNSDLPLIDNPHRLGCIFIFNGEKEGDDIQENQYKTLSRFIDRLVNAEKTFGKVIKLPLAVVLTKFDKYEKYFDSNSHCLRGDVKDMALFVRKELRYAGSALQNNIDMASAEIESFLKGHFKDNNKNIFDLINSNAKYFSEVKYFGVSTVGFDEALKHIEGSSRDVLQFLTAPKRLELPFIWMLSQYGIID